MSFLCCLPLKKWYRGWIRFLHPNRPIILFVLLQFLNCLVHVRQQCLRKQQCHEASGNRQNTKDDHGKGDTQARQLGLGNTDELLLPETHIINSLTTHKPVALGFRIECWFLMRGKIWSTRRKPLGARRENQQQTQPTYDAGSGNRTQATLVGGERSPMRHPCSPNDNKVSGAN